MTDWVIHFIHDYSDAHEPDDRVMHYEYYGSYPYHEDKDLNDRFDCWRISDDYYALASTPNAHFVLRKIMLDGHIRATWAFKNGRATVYGPRAAVCFTEMSLSAWQAYSEERGPEAVGKYAIAILKDELYRAGGRPVLYGLSGRHRETSRKKPLDRGWPRILHPSCGITESEQYRYVALRLNTKGRIDWTHEREWRWVDGENTCSCPGLPLWLADDPLSFSRIRIIVPRARDRTPILDLLKQLHDSGANEFDHPFCRRTLESTGVVCTEDLEESAGKWPAREMRLEDIRESQVSKFSQPVAPPQLLSKLRTALSAAEREGDKAAAACRRERQLSPDGRHVLDVAGWAQVWVEDSQSPIVAGLQQLEAGYMVPGKGYSISSLGGLGWRGDQALCLAEAKARAAMSALEREFPDVVFSITSKWD